MTHLVQVISAAVFFALGAGTVAYIQPEHKKPCINNFADSWLWFMEQNELRDVDETEAERKFHAMIVKVVTDQNGLYTSRSGAEYIVPSNCYVEDTGFFVKLWQKE